MTQFLRYAAKSDVGMVRRDNEDSGYAGRTLLVVADGMGGHAAGELASSTAVATLAELDSEDLPAGDVLTALDDAMLTSAERIAQFIEADPSRAGMGTTLTAVLWRGGRIALIHVGDSRAYLLRDGQLSQITHDHTYVQTLIDSGRITAEEARTHPKRNLLLRAIDGTGVPEGETSIREAQVGDRYLLCSDGLCGVVTDDAIEAVLAQVPDPTAAVTELVDLALAAGAPDNVTAVIADVIEVDDADQDLESALGGPVVVGAAGDRRNRAALPGLMFPDDVGPGDDGNDAPGGHGGPVVAGGLAARSQVRSRSGSADDPGGQGDDEFADEGQPGAPLESDRVETGPPPPGSIGAAVEAGSLPVASASAAVVGALPDEPEPAQPGWLRRHWRAVAAVAVVGRGPAGRCAGLRVVVELPVVRGSQRWVRRDLPGDPAAGRRRAPESGRDAHGAAGGVTAVLRPGAAVGHAGCGDRVRGATDRDRPRGQVRVVHLGAGSARVSRRPARHGLRDDPAQPLAVAHRLPRSPAVTATVIPGSAQSQVGSAQPTRRNTELALLVLVWLIGALALVLASEGAVGEVVADVRTIVIIEGVCLLGIHLVVRWLAPYADPVMLPTAAALNVLGIAMIGRLDIADAKRAAAKGVEIPDSVAVQQAIWMAVGVVACALVLVIVRDHRTLRRYTYLIGLAGLVLLLLPMVPGLGLTIRGANLWIQVGPFTFQPAELAKVLLTIFFASYLVQTRESLSLVRHKVLGLGIPRGRDLGPILVAWAIAMGIVVFQRDLGTAAMFFGLFVGLLYVATGRRSWIILGFLLTVFGAVMAYLAFSHVQIRVKVWLDPFAYSSAEGYQIVESLYGFANGGMMGTGWGRGYPQLVPFAESDFIFAALGEELGMAGGFAVIVLFAILIERALRVAHASRDPFGTLLVTGYAIVLGLQTFIVLGGVTKLIPHTGLTTPFMSAGGSSLLANWIILGLLLRVSDHVRRPDPVIIRPDDATTEVVRVR